MGKSKKHESKSKTKHKRKERNEKKKKTKKQSKEKKNRGEKERKTRDKLAVKTDDQGGEDFSIPVDLMNSKSHAPETPEEYQQRQNRMRREFDPVTGRSRLIKGDGEVLEEIVSRERHKAVNKEATKGDGDFFQKNTVNKLK